MNNEVVLQSSSVAGTEAIAASLAAALVPNDVVTLAGELGAGKTQFVRGLIRGLGGDPRAVSSPTFALLHVYPTGRLVVNHLDAYRVQGGDDFDAIGFDELLDAGGVTVVEWAERVIDRIPTGAWRVDLRAVSVEQRVVHITPPSGRRVPA